MIIFAYFVFGALLGSFLGVLADRLPVGEDVIWGRSHCDYCKKPLRWFELVPIVSFMVAGGRCLRCKKRLSVAYPLIEIASGVLWAFIAWQHAATPLLLVLYGIFWSALLVITVADMKFQIIPDSMVVIGLLSAAGLLVMSPAPQGYVLSSVACAAFFYALWRITRGRGMGFGDVKLALVLGLFLGYPLSIVCLYVAFLTGAGWGVILILRRQKTLKSKVAFGPFLVFGALIAWLYGQSIVALWRAFV